MSTRKIAYFYDSDVGNFHYGEFSVVVGLYQLKLLKLLANNFTDNRFSSSKIMIPTSLGSLVAMRFPSSSGL